MEIMIMDNAEKSRSICNVPGIRVGHAQDETARTGCTVVIPDGGAVGGVDVRGSSPGTREVELLKPVRNVEKIHAILLTGGSAFGLNAAGGVQAYLEEQGIGYDVGVARIPLVSAAVIFDLFVGDPKIRPDHQMGYDACVNASSKESREGLVGVGMGATVGKVGGGEGRSNGGLGTCAEVLDNGVVIGAIAVANSYGDVVDPHSGEIIGGNRQADGRFLDSVSHLKKHPVNPFAEAGANTSLAVVATNARFNKEQITKVAQMAQVGISRTTNPAHTMFDGDIVFALSLGEVKADVTVVGMCAAELVAEAMVRGVRAGMREGEKRPETGD
jgi:L-aminopeptidase/D-esterase-like protein